MQVPQVWRQQGESPLQQLPAARLLLIISGLAMLGFVTLAVLITAVSGADPVDAAVYQLVQADRTAAGTGVATVLTTLGSYQVVIMLTIAAAVLALAMSRRFVEPAVLLLSAPFTSSLVYLIKLALGRARPPSALLMGEAPNDYSFPSGHTTSGTVLFILSTVIISSFVLRIWIRRLLRVAGIAVAILIGFSRVYLGYHWTTDVVAGWLLAASIVAASTLVVVTVNRVRAAAVVDASEPQTVALESGRAASLR